MKYILSIFIFLFFYSGIQAASNDSLPSRLPFLAPAAKLNKARFWSLTTATTIAYSATVVGLDRAWYAGYPRSRFHFFDDWNGWRQMDKMGHAFTAYFESRWVGEMYVWAGVAERKAAYIGAGAGLLFQTSLEMLDGFSSAWGFSWGDMAFNTVGSGLYLGQQLAWKEQRIRLKMSSHRPRYSHSPIQATNSNEVSSVAERAQSLFGTSFPELLFKEYNGQTIWLSANIAAFLPNRPKYLPTWLNIAVGYGIENVLGAERNSWTNANGSIFVAPSPARMSQYFLSFDIDFERIKTRHRWLRTLFKVINIFKIPFPTLELNSAGHLRFRPFYF
jgi:hypothetical protein